MEDWRNDGLCSSRRPLTIDSAGWHGCGNARSGLGSCELVGALGGWKGDESVAREGGESTSGPN